MGATGSRETGVLVRHFFRRFFDNDTVHTSGDTVTTVVRALAFCAVPGLMVAFFLQNQYPVHPQRSVWGQVQDEYFFVLLSFVVLGGVAVFEWEMLFPDRLDLLVLTPLGVPRVRMLGAKAAALAGFLGLFLFGSNAFGLLVYPAVTKWRFWGHVEAQSAAVGMAGVFAASAVLAVRGAMLCCLPARWVRRLGPVVQMLCMVGLVLLVLHYVLYAASSNDGLRDLMGSRVARWLPPLWFLGVYERVLRGAEAPAFAAGMARLAVEGTAMAAGVAVVLYPVAWARMQRMTMEEATGQMRVKRGWMAAVVTRAVGRPGERAVMHFTGLTLARMSRYQVYLAMYCGTGLALGLASAVMVHAQGGRVWLGLSARGLHALMPLMLFWTVAGLRTAFALPLSLTAAWVFRMAGTGERASREAAGRWATGAALFVAAGLVGLLAAGWGARALAVQAVFGVCLGILLADAFFFEQAIPFTRPRMPGRTNFPLLVTLYVGVLGPFVMGVAMLTERMERMPWEMLWVVALTVAVHVGVRRMQAGPVEVEEEQEGYDEDFQLLGLG